MTKISRRTMRAWFASLLMASIGTIGLTATPASAGTSIYQFNVDIYGCGLSGLAPASSAVTIRIKNSRGDLKQVVHLNAAGDGSWYVPDCLDTYIVPGDKVRITDGSSHRSITVPNITVNVDRGTDTVWGYALPDSSVQVTLLHCPTFDGSCTVTPTHGRPTNGHGRYSMNYSGHQNIKGRDYAKVLWIDHVGDYFYAYGDAPNIQVTIGSSHFSGKGNANSLVTVALKTAGGALLGTGRAVASFDYGYIDGDFLADRGAPVPVKAGDKVDPDFSGGAALTVPNLVINPNPGTDHVTGTCLPNRSIEVYAADESSPYRDPSYAYVDVMADGAGHFDADMTTWPSFDLEAGDFVQVYCITPSGDEVSAITKA